LVMTSNFGAEGVVVIDKIARIAPRTPIIYLETGYQFAETDRLKEQLRARYDLQIIEYRAELSVAEQDRIYGENLYQSDPDLCCRMRKVEPLGRALKGYRAWIAALRRDQSPTRADIGIVEWNVRHGMIKINPLATWTRKDVWEYIMRKKLPYNPLYDDGYASIGCQPCTRRVAAGQHERSGRWDGEKRLECGIHL
jgi:phosphoadenosine phosphosulfate reductase